MGKNVMISVLLLVPLIGVTLGANIECYKCGLWQTSVNDKNCSDENVKSKYEPKTCSTDSSYCIKILFDGFYARSCAPDCEETAVLKCCDSDGCNGSTAVATNFVGLVATLFAGVVFTKIQ